MEIVGIFFFRRLCKWLGRDAWLSRCLLFGSAWAVNFFGSWSCRRDGGDVFVEPDDTGEFRSLKVPSISGSDCGVVLLVHDR